MIVPGTEFILATVPLSRIVVTEHQARYPERVQHYARLLMDPANAGHYPGLVHLAPYGTNSKTGEPLYTLLDGHHRYLASIIAGRADVLALILIEPGWPEATAELAHVVTGCTKRPERQAGTLYDGL